VECGDVTRTVPAETVSISRESLTQLFNAFKRMGLGDYGPSGPPDEIVDEHNQIIDEVNQALGWFPTVTAKNDDSEELPF
jgi:hypothetical protein